jgi:hypothetical protein
VAASRSSDGINWSNPITVTGSGSADKNWIVCDNTATSHYYGHCYSEWDDTSQGDLIRMSTSTDGGQTCGLALTTAGQDFGIGGVPVVKPCGKVIVPILGFKGYVIAFSSANGGKSWTKAVIVATYTSHGEAGGLEERWLGLVGGGCGGQGVCDVAGLPLPHDLFIERHRVQHVGNRDDVGGSQARADRRGYEHGGSFHQRRCGCAGYEGSQGSHRARVLLLYGVELREQLFAECRVHSVFYGGLNVDRGRNADRSNAAVMAAKYFLRDHGGRLHLRGICGRQGFSGVCGSAGENGISFPRGDLHHLRQVRFCPSRSRS